MSDSQQKRSSSGYRLRTQGGKKHLSADFEYYFSKVGTLSENKLFASPENNNTARRQRLKLNKIPKCHAIAQQKLSALDFAQYIVDDNKIVYLNIDHQTEEKAMPSADSIPRQNLNGETMFQALTTTTDEETLAEEDGLEIAEISVLPGGDDEDDEALKENIVLGSKDKDGTVVAKKDAFAEGKRKCKKAIRNHAIDDIGLDDITALHSDDRIECIECHKLLKPNSFRQHLRTHTGEKPFSCSQCDAHFTRKGDVDRHVRIVHNKQKPFECSHCKRSFGDKKNLRWHLENHDKKLFYVCPVCGFKFGKKEYFENHVRYLHPETVQEELNQMSAENDNLKLMPEISQSSYDALEQNSSSGKETKSESPDLSVSSNIGAVLVQFDEDGKGSIANSESIKCIGVPDQPTCEEGIFEMVFSDAEWPHALDSFSENLKDWTTDQAFQENAPHVIQLVTDKEEHGSKFKYLVETGKDAQIAQCMNDGDAEAKYMIGDNGTLILGDNRSPLVQFVVNDCTVVTGTDQLLASHSVRDPSSLTLKHGASHVRDHSTESQNNIEESGLSNNMIEALLVAAGDSTDHDN